MRPLKKCLNIAAALAALTTACAARPGETALPAEEPVAAAGVAGQSPDLTELVSRCFPAAVDLKGFSPNTQGYFDIGVGSGVFIHEDGYILTANHVAKDDLGIAPEARMWNGAVHRYRIVTRLGDDLAIVKVDAGKPLPWLPLGRSHDLMLGEPVLIIGNPDGLNHSVSDSLVSGINRSGPGVFLPGMFQVNGSVNGGNSGGPVINALGEVIGIIQSKEETAENIAFALPADHVRKRCAERMTLERWQGVWLGMTVDPYGPGEVTAVEPGSPAAKAGARVGDVVCRAGTTRVSDSVHFYFSLVGRKAGEAFPVEVERDGKKVALDIRLETVPMADAVKVRGLVPGLKFTAYQGTWTSLPDFDKLTPVESGRTDTFPPANCKAAANPFALKFAGYVRVPADGVYNFYVASDDGSRLWIGDELVVDNDGLHGTVERGGFIALKAGLHPITVGYFDAGGGKALSVSYDGPNLPRQAIPPSALFGEP